MCLGIPAMIVEILDRDTHRAVAEVEGVRREVNIGLVLDDGLQEGDWVLIHVGFAMGIIDADEAERTLELVRVLEEGLEGELSAFGEPTE